jgi:hypothetical protein
MTEYQEKHHCSKCGAWLTDEQIVSLEYVDDLFERVLPGDIFPTGECPGCGGLTIPARVVRRDDAISYLANTIIRHYNDHYNESLAGPLLDILYFAARRAKGEV